MCISFTLKHLKIEYITFNKNTHNEFVVDQIEFALTAAQKMCN